MRAMRNWRSASTTSLLLDCGVLMGPLFVGTALVAGATRTQYSPRRHPVSALARGGSGWVQTANFLTAGTLTCLFAVGARRALRGQPGRTTLPLLLGGAGVGLLGAGTFVTDPVSGYPPDVPDRTAQRTRTGLAHELFSVPVLLGIPVAAVTHGIQRARRGQRRWAAYCIASAAVSLTGFLASGAGFGGMPRYVNWAGLLQRVGIVTAFGWMSVLALRLRRNA
jgi:hypothetical protein